MKKVTLLLPFLLLFLLLTACVSTGGYSKYESKEEKRIEDAYALQRVSVLQRSSQDPIVGYKAGLTSEKAQDAFDVDEPLVAVLFRSGLAFERSAYLLANYRDLRLETELGFILRQSITQEISEEDLPKYIKSMVPVVELPNLKFVNPDNITAISLVSSNVASNHYIIGKPQYFDMNSINDFSTTLSKNGVIINQGQATDAMGDQKAALVWMINRLLAIGYPLQRDHLLITGALGTMLPAEKGQYEARFGIGPEKNSIIAFSIR